MWDVRATPAVKHLRPDGTMGEADTLYTVMPDSGQTRGISVLHSMFDQETGERIGVVEIIVPRPVS